MKLATKDMFGNVNSHPTIPVSLQNRLELSIGGKNDQIRISKRTLAIE